MKLCVNLFIKMWKKFKEGYLAGPEGIFMKLLRNTVLAENKFTHQTSTKINDHVFKIFWATNKIINR